MDNILFLTACVNPKGMVFTALKDTEIRKQQYVNALKWYLEYTSLRILFVENTNTDLSGDFIPYIKQGRLEMLTFNGNDYDRSFGKGYGEARIMRYGFEHSRFLHQSEMTIIKVTGRFVCHNINDIVSRYSSPKTLYANIGKDDWGGNIANSGFVIAPHSFWNEYFLPRREELNDSMRFHFEHLLYESICRWKKNGMKHREFWINPQMEGVSGTSGKHSRTSNCRNFKSKMLYILHRIGYRGYFNPFYKGDPNFVING